MAASAEAVFAMGAAALDNGDLAGAERLFRAIVEVDRRAHPAWNALSVVAVRSGDPEAALEHATRALDLDRRNPFYLNNLGVACGELGRFAEAAENFRRALKAKPVYAEAMFNLGKALHKQSDLQASLRAYERAYAMDARFPGLPIALAYMHLKCGAPLAARAILERLVEPSEQEAIAYATCLLESEGLDPAALHLRKAMVQHPDWADARTALATLLLSNASWREGWHLYLARPFRPKVATASQAPLAAVLDGRRILLRAEQGIGDVLFFLRFVPELVRRGARSSLACNPRMAAILDGSQMLAEIRAKYDQATPGEYDEEIPVGDLPGRLGIDDCPPAWSLRASQPRREEMKTRLAGLGPPPYLGVTWRAGTDVLRQREFGNERRLLMKELPPDALGAAVRGWPGTVVALQRGMRASELAAFAQAAQAPVHDLSALTEDLSELIAALALLDEYVAVSNTNIHLLAGLGRSARVLVPYPAEWRWGREGASPWFPAVTVYREPQSRGWTLPLSHLRRDLIG